MPVKKVKGGFRWGKHGKVYKSRAKAAAQGRAAYANGYRGDAKEKARTLKASVIAEQRYVRDLRNISKQVAKGTVASLEKHHPGLARADSSGRISPRGDTLQVLGLRVQTHVREETGKAFDRMSAQVNKQATKAVQGLVGIPMARTAPEPLIDTFRQANIALMEKAGRTYVDKVRDVLEDPENEGLRVEEIADLLGERAGVFGWDAERIARDQTLKLNANIAEQRMSDAGVTRYTWSTSQDERVRPMHAELEGREFAFEDPPVTNEEGETNNPGEDILCRCVALPVLPDFDAL